MVRFSEIFNCPLCESTYPHCKEDVDMCLKHREEAAQRERERIARRDKRKSEREERRKKTRDEAMRLPYSTEETLQVGEDGADIEMHILRNKVGIYFVDFVEYVVNSDNMRVPKDTEERMVHPFISKEEVYKAFGKQMNGKKITI